MPVPDIFNRHRAQPARRPERAMAVAMLGEHRPDERALGHGGRGMPELSEATEAQVPETGEIRGGEMRAAGDGSERVEGVLEVPSERREPQRRDVGPGADLEPRAEPPEAIRQPNRVVAVR